MPDYEHFVGSTIPDYFTMILLKKSSFKSIGKANYAPFANSVMGRKGFKKKNYTKLVQDH